MVINASTLAGLLGVIRLAFNEGQTLAQATADYSRWAVDMPSTTSIQRYPMMLFLAAMRRWRGGRQLKNLVAKYLEVTNDDHEITWAIPMNDLEDDNIGYIQPAFVMAGQTVAAYWGELATLELCTNGNWLDGSAFFGTTRTLGDSGAIANYVTDPLTQTTFQAGYLAMQSYKLPNGKPGVFTPDILMVGPKNRTVAHGIVNQGPGATAANPDAGIVQVIVNPYLIGDYDDYWFLMCTTRGIKPVIVQKRKDGAIVSKDKPEDDTVFFGSASGLEGESVPGGVAVYGKHNRGECAKTLPYLIYAGMF